MQPDYVYLRHVPLRKVHLFTIIQMICFALLYAIKPWDYILKRFVDHIKSFFCESNWQVGPIVFLGSKFAHYIITAQ